MGVQRVRSDAEGSINNELRNKPLKIAQNYYTRGSMLNCCCLKFKVEWRQCEQYKTLLQLFRNTKRECLKGKMKVIRTNILKTCIET
jgi:hypothetical protein